jgi:hypothetical protein
MPPAARPGRAVSATNLVVAQLLTQQSYAVEDDPVVKRRLSGAIANASGTRAGPSGCGRGSLRGSGHRHHLSSPLRDRHARRAN